MQSIYRNGIRKEKCAMLVMKSCKRYILEGVELPNQVVIRMFREKKAYKYFEILEAGAIKQRGMEEKIKKRISRKS